MVVCVKCGVDKPQDGFHYRTDTGKFRPECKTCRNAQHLARVDKRRHTPEWKAQRLRFSRSQHAKRENDTELRQNDRLVAKLARYGLSKEDYLAMHVNQRDCCAICGRHKDLFKNKLSIDHIHSTGQVRELLCHHCNLALGMAKDSIKILEGLLSYVQQYC